MIVVYVFYYVIVQVVILTVCKNNVILVKSNTIDIDKEKEIDYIYISKPLAIKINTLMEKYNITKNIQQKMDIHESYVDIILEGKENINICLISKCFLYCSK